VLLHGGGDSGEHSFEQQIELFSKHHRIIAPDQVGQGRTPDVPDLELQQHDAGHRGAAAGNEDSPHRRGRFQRWRHPGPHAGGSPSGTGATPCDQWREHCPEGLTDEHREGLIAAQNPKPSNIDEKLTQLWLTSPTHSELNPDVLAKIQKPVLVVSGDRDAIRLEHTLEIFRALPQAELCILPGTDHGTFSAGPSGSIHRQRFSRPAVEISRSDFVNEQMRGPRRYKSEEWLP